MNNVQRLEIEQNFFTDAIILLTCAPKDVSKHVSELSKKYCISKEAVYYRIRTKYGDKLANVRIKYRQPNKDVLLQIVRLSNSTEEVQQKLNLTDWEFIGLYDRVLGISTFHKAKMLSLKDMEITKYTPSIKDNRSLIYGMRLGDASYDSKRKSMRIEHCYRQKDWLEKKVELLSLAYPYISKNIVERVRTPKNTFYWYSRKLLGSAVQYNEISKEQMANDINQFGLFVLYLDDGNLGTYGSSSVLGFAVQNKHIGEVLIKNLKSFGFDFKQETDNYISIKRKSAIQTYLNEMILPFIELVPNSMKYKTVLMV